MRAPVRSNHISKTSNCFRQSPKPSGKNHFTQPKWQRFAVSRNFTPDTYSFCSPGGSCLAPIYEEQWHPAAHLLRAWLVNFCDWDIVCADTKPFSRFLGSQCDWAFILIMICGCSATERQKWSKRLHTAWQHQTPSGKSSLMDAIISITKCKEPARRSDHQMGPRKRKKKKTPGKAFFFSLSW